jgi:chemotaxis protein methyltransferase CheR
MNAATLTDEELERFIALVYRVSGIRIPNTKKILVSNRVRRRLRANGIQGFSEYYAFLTSAAGAKEMPLFLDEITTNETFFFRDVHQYEWFNDKFLPEIARQSQARERPKRLRVWSAAASTGAELYSIAVRIHEQKQRFAGWTIQLLGTDLSGAALNSAREGAYDDRVLRLVDPAVRRRYFDHDPATERWSIKSEIRDMVSWKQHNLMEPLDEAPFDCVLLKNVLIYFDAKSKETVAARVLKAVAPRGYLVLGPTEVIANLLAPLRKIETWLYQRPV